MLGLDLYNGNATQVAAFKAVTQVQFPLLKNAAQPGIPWGLGVEKVIIVDREGIVRGVESAVNTDQINDLIQLTENPAPRSDVGLTSLYYGRSIGYGSTHTITATVANPGLRPLEVTGVESTSPSVVPDRTTFTVAPGESEEITFTLVTTTEGTVSGQVTIRTNHHDWVLPIADSKIEAPLRSRPILS